MWRIRTNSGKNYGGRVDQYSCFFFIQLSFTNIYKYLHVSFLVQCVAFLSLFIDNGINKSKLPHYIMYHQRTTRFALVIWFHYDLKLVSSWGVGFWKLYAANVLLLSSSIIKLNFLSDRLIVSAPHPHLFCSAAWRLQAFKFSRCRWRV